MAKRTMVITIQPDGNVRLDIEAPTMRECDEIYLRQHFVMALIGVEGGESIRVPPPPQIPLEEALRETVKT